jgi:hypothetical protein
VPSARRRGLNPSIEIVLGIEFRSHVDAQESRYLTVANSLAVPFIAAYPAPPGAVGNVSTQKYREQERLGRLDRRR